MDRAQSTQFESLIGSLKPTDESCESMISSEHYWRVPGTYMTVCALVLCTGYTITGESACATPEEFDEEIGRRVARANAKRKIKTLECYALRVGLLAYK